MFRFGIGILFLLHFHSSNSNELKDLTKNFFENLEINLLDRQPTNESITFTDKQVENFIDLIRTRQHIEEKRTKRQIVEIGGDRSFEIQILEGLTPLQKIPSTNPKDLQLFQHEVNNTKIWYAVILENNNTLKIYKQRNKHFIKLEQRNVHSAVRLVVFPTSTGTFIVAAENTTANNFHEKTVVYRFSTNENIEKIQNLHIDYAVDIAIWSDKGNTYMAIVQQFKEHEKTKKKSCETQSKIYKWLGGHFDIIQSLNTFCAVKVTPFSIGRTRFIGIANQGSDDGTSDTYSEIFKYDLDLEQFVSYQKIATRGASDIKFFAFRNNASQERPQESFIVIANTYSKDENGIIDYNVKSIVYKFVEGYFLPFQSFDLDGVTQWLPSVGNNGEFVLFAVSKFEGLKTYQYNGWKFQPTRNQNTHKAFSPGIQSVHTYNYQEKQILVVAHPQSEYNVFELHFKLENQIKEKYNNLLNWCQQKVQEFKTDKKNKKRSPSKRQTNTKGLREVEGDLSSEKDLEHNLTFIEIQLETQQEQLNKIEKKLNQSTEILIIPGDLIVRNVVINNEVLFNQLNGETMNDLNIVAFLNDIVPIDTPRETGKTVPRLELHTATIENLITAGIRTINGHPPEDLLHTNVDNLSVNELIINGNFYVDDLQIKGTLNNLFFNASNVLLQSGDQFFVGNLTANSIIANEVTAKFLNKLNLHTQPNHTTVQISSVDTLKVKHLTVAGFMNHVDLPTLNKYALKNHGHQKITKEYIFGNLSLNNFQTETLNHFAIPDDLVRISEGEYFVHQDVQFEQDIQAQNLDVKDRLNEIIVLENGELDVLRKNTTEMQYIDGEKIIQEVELLRPMVLQGNIDSDSLQELNPVTKITDPIELLGDYTITGTVTIEDQLSARDLGSDEFTISNLRKNGVKLTDSQIPVALNFTQLLNTGEIFVDKINGIDINHFVVHGTKEDQYIKGWKKFEGDLTITGNTNLQIFNHINVPELSENVLRIDGDQIITGKHDFKNVDVGKIKSPKITLQSKHNIEDMLAQDNEQLLGDAFIGQLSINHLKANNVEVQNMFNGINLEQILEDTLFKNQEIKIYGHKHFDNITIFSLQSRKSINMNRIPNLIKRSEAVTGDSSNIQLPAGIKVENIKFGNFINNISAETFANNWLNDSPMQTIEGDQYFSKVVVFGNLLIDSGKINELNLKELVEDTVKANETFKFQKVAFDKSVTSIKKIDLHGHIENLDIDTILADSGEETVADSLSFKESVTILTPSNLEGKINGLNLSQLCAYSHPKEGERSKNLIIKNNAESNSPIVLSINGKNMNELESTIWFNDKPSNVPTLRAESINFQDDISVDGLVSETNLQWLRDNYFSKSRNQTITANIQFQEGLLINGDLKAPRANIHSINEVPIDEFVRTVLLQDWDQTFEEPFLAKDITINQLQGDYRVNGYNLQTDVMRYDADNIVTGKITIDDADVDILNTDRTYKVQSVDLKHWTQNGVLKTGSQSVQGRLIFESETVFEKGIGLTGVLNKKEFNEERVLLKSKAQTVTGQKIFIGNQYNTPEFKDVKMKGAINGVKFHTLVESQALKSTDNTFRNIINFHTNLVGQNVIFEGLYQGVNVTDLLNNLTANAFVENYYEYYDKLRDASRAVKKSLSNKANNLNYFRTMQSIETLLDLIPMRSFRGKGLHLATLRTQNNTFIMDFFKWLPFHGQFTIDSDMKQITFPQPISYWTPLEYSFRTYLYIEYESPDGYGNTHMGHIMGDQEANLEIIASIASNGTRKVLPLFLPNTQKTCMILVHSIANHMDIFCRNDDYSLELHQSLPIYNALQVDVGVFGERLEIHAIEKNIPDKHIRPKHENHPAVIIWLYDEHTELFNEQQRIFTSTPISISSAKHNSYEYLAVASGHLVNTMYSGQVDIKRYDPVKKQYIDWQVFRANAPLQIHLSVLPSNELILYVLKNSLTDILSIYEYTGIGKFADAGTISTLQNCNAIQPFNYILDEANHSIHEHFIIAKCNGAINIVQSVFKR